MKRFVSSTSYAWPALCGVVILFVLNVAFSPSFVDSSQWAPLLTAASPFILTGMAQAPAVMSGRGGIDLSIGPLAGLVSVIVPGALIPHGITSPVPVIALALAAGAGGGLVNGILIAYVRVPPIIATLGTYFVYSALALRVLPTAGGTIPHWLAAVGTSYGPIPAMFVPIAACAVIWLVLQRTSFSRNLFAVGGDDRAAYTAGVDVAGTRAAAFALSGLLAAIAGLGLTAAISSGDPNIGPPYTLYSIAAVALGGISLAGGRGGLLGAALGGSVLFLTQNLLTVAHLSVFALQIATGLILLLALALNAMGERLRHRRREPGRPSVGLVRAIARKP